jgi:hypothetical protein
VHEGALPEPPRTNTELWVGWLEESDSNGYTLTGEQREILTGCQTHNPFAVTVAADAYRRWLEENAGDLGFTHVERHVYRGGKHTTTVRRIAPTRAPLSAPQRTNGNGRGGRPRAQAARSGAKSGDSGEDGLDPPAKRPRGNGAARLLFDIDLVAGGLDEDALERAAALVLTLDEDARRERQAVAS